MRYVPGALAAAMVELGIARHTPTLGRVREITLVQTAASFAERIGDATGECRAVRFTRWEYLEASGTRIVQHHPRCVYE